MKRALTYLLLPVLPPTGGSACSSDDLERIARVGTMHRAYLAAPEVER